MWNKENKSNQNINLIKWTTPEIVELEVLFTQSGYSGSDDGVDVGTLSG
jgi:hypothetical protein